MDKGRRILKILAEIKPLQLSAVTEIIMPLEGYRQYYLSRDIHSALEASVEHNRRFCRRLDPPFSCQRPLFPVG